MPQISASSPGLRRKSAAQRLAVAMRSTPLVTRGLAASVWALPLHFVTGLATLGAIGALWGHRYRLARLAAAAQVSWLRRSPRKPFLLLTLGTTCDLELHGDGP
jgi:hypothetical protein